jgi:hypothetical protein
MRAKPRDPSRWAVTSAGTNVPAEQSPRGHNSRGFARMARSYDEGGIKGRASTWRW